MRVQLPLRFAARSAALAVRLVAVVAVVALVAPTPALAVVTIPELRGPVMDEARLLDSGQAGRLAALAQAARARDGGQGVQLQYFIVRSLDGEAIEDLSIRAAERWKIGSSGKDNGVLVTVAVEDRAVRIEVGGGLEGGLTDAQSSRIIRGTIVPAFQAGRFGDGLYEAGVQVLGALGALPAGVQATRPARPQTRFSSLAIIAMMIVFFVIRVLTGFGPRRRRSLWWGGGPGMGGGSWGGGGGFGGGGGGGWSGGGGGFSGGGASGRW